MRTLAHISRFKKKKKVVPICVVLQWLGHHIDEYVMPLMNWESISYAQYNNGWVFKPLTHVYSDRNPALEDQACDRIYRVGQTKDVTIHR